MNNQLGKFKKIFIYFNAALLLILLGAGTYYTISLYSKAQSCLTIAEVQQDTQCLYIYNAKVYENGTQAAPFQNIPCGSDISSIIADESTLVSTGYIYQADICSGATPTTVPTLAASPTALPLEETITATPSPTIEASPSATLMPSETPTTEPTPLTTLPVTGRLEWLAAAMIPIGLVILGVIF